MILVTGGAGYIGSHTVVELLKANHSVLVVDNFSNSHPDVLKKIRTISGKDFSFEQIDLTDRSALNIAFEKYPISCVLHFAAYKSVGESVADSLLYYQNNLFSLINVLACCKEFGITQMVFSSSCTVYGQPENILIDENVPIAKVASPYGNTKKISEEIIFDYAVSSPFDCILLRYFNPIGAHESGLLGDEPQGIPNNLIPYLTKVVDGELPYLRVFGNDYNTPDGTCIRDYIHVVDLAIAHLKAVDYLKEHQRKGVEAINIGTGKGHSVLEVIHTFEKATGKKVNYQFNERRPGDVVAIYASPEKAKNVLKWTAKYSLEEMLSSAWNYQTKKRT